MLCCLSILSGCGIASKETFQYLHRYIQAIEQNISTAVNSTLYFMLLPDESQIIVTYDVSDNKLEYPHQLTTNEYWASYSREIEKHQQLWLNITSILPEDTVHNIHRLTLYSDGYANELAAVEPLSWNNEKWKLYVDVSDLNDPIQWVDTLVHEHGHILTLGQHQMDGDNYSTYFCDTFVTDYGCSEEDAYIYQFYKQFWEEEMIEEWEARGLAEDDDGVGWFYMDYEDQFVSEYAATSIYEDIAEAWSYYVLYTFPEGDEIWEKKVQFFESYPELRELKSIILENVTREYEDIQFPI